MLPNFEEDRISFIKVGALLEGFLCESWTMLFRFRVASARPPRGSMPILFRESSTVVMRYCSPKNMELIWF